MKIQKFIDLKIPRIPNYILINDGKARSRSEEGPKMHISEFTEDQLRSIGEEWTLQLIEKARRLNEWEKPASESDI